MCGRLTQRTADRARQLVGECSGPTRVEVINPRASPSSRHDRRLPGIAGLAVESKLEDRVVPGHVDPAVAVHVGHVALGGPRLVQTILEEIQIASVHDAVAAQIARAEALAE